MLHVGRKVPEPESAVPELIPGDRLTIVKIAGLTAALGGLAVAMGEGFAAPGRPTLMGDLLSLLAAVLWGATTVFVRSTALKLLVDPSLLLSQDRR